MPEVELVTVTPELLLAGRSERGGWSKAQLSLLSVVWPPPAGWKDEVVGRAISRADAERFVELRASGPSRGLF